MFYNTRLNARRATRERARLFELFATLAAPFDGVSTFCTPEIRSRWSQHAWASSSAGTVRSAHGHEREFLDNLARVDVDVL